MTHFFPEGDLNKLHDTLAGLVTLIDSHASNDPNSPSVLNASHAKSLLHEVRKAAEVVEERAGSTVSSRFEHLSAKIDQLTQRYVRVEAMEELVQLAQADDSTAQRIRELKDWWAMQSSDAADMVAEKAVTYGSNSLTQLGRKMAQLAGREATDEEAQELGVWVYIVGKVERWTDAVMRGERPKEDTLLDIAVYATMAQRIRHAGGWPDSIGA